MATRTALRCITALVMGALLQLATVVASAHDFGGSSSGGGNDPPPPAPPCNSCPCAGPGGGSSGGGPGNGGGAPGGSVGGAVSLFNGAEELAVTDLVVNGVFPIVITRKYDSRSTYDSALGYGWTFFHDRHLYEYSDSSIVVRHGCGTRDRYVPGGGGYVSPVGGMLSQLTANGDGTFNLKFLNGIIDHYDSQGRLTAVEDVRGNRLEYTYDSRGKLPLTGSSKEAVDPNLPMTVAYIFRITRIDERAADGALTGHFVTFDYNETTGRLSGVTANDGRTVTYQQDITGSLTKGNLVQVNGLEGIIATYAYADARDPHNLTTQVPAQGRTPLVETYDDQDRVTREVEGTRQLDFTYQTPYTKTLVTKTVRDPAGANPYTAATTYEFDTSGRATKITDALGNETRYTYDAAKNLTRREVWQKSGTTLALLQATDWTYDLSGNKLTQTAALDGGETVTMSWTYDHGWIASEQVVSSAAPTKLFRTEYAFVYGADGSPTNVAQEKRRRDDGSFQTTAFTYDGRNRLATVTLPDGVQVINEYSGEYVTHRYFSVGGSPLPQMDQQFEYDAQGNLIKEWDARGNLTQYGYDTLRRLISETNPLGEQRFYTYVQYKLTQIESGHTTADGEGQVTKLLYDTRDRLTGVQRKNDAGTFVNFQTFQLDSEGQRVAVTDGEGRTWRIAYDLLGRDITFTDPANKITRTAYDAVGNRTSIIDGRNDETRYEYDDLNRRTAIVQLGVTPNPRTQLTYDAAGNLTSALDAEGHATTYEYDALSRRTRVTQPLGQQVQYSYDSRDRLSVWINARGNKITFGYEPWGELNEEREFATATATTPTRIISYGHDNDGNVTAVTDDAIQSLPAYAMTYDALGRMLDETVKYIPGGDRVLQHRYDRFGNRKQLTLQDGTSVASAYTFNKLNQLSSATLAGGAIGISYFANDTRQGMTLPNGVSEAFTYQSNGPVQSIAVNGPSSSLAQFAYTYDDALNVATQTDLYGSHQFTYDGLNRLTAATRPATSGLPNESYVYDRVGNREDAGNPALYSYDANNRISASPGQTYTFDDDGNLSTRSDGATFGYDKRNRLATFAKSSVNAAYVYDDRGRRVRKTVNGADVWFLWDGTKILAEYDGSGVRVQRYGYLPGDFVPTQVQDANGTYYVHSDHLQTPRLMTDSSAQTVWRSKHEAFGNAVIDADVDGNSVAVALKSRFPGQSLDAESGLSYNRFRDYDPQTGRYVESDPIGLSGGFNLYAYALGNPTTLIDPLGLQTPALCLNPANVEACVAAGEITESQAAAIKAGVNAAGATTAAAVGAAAAAKAKEREDEYQAYKRRCNEQPPGGLSQCEEARWKLQRNKDCRRMRQDWDDKWQPGRHQNDIDNLDRGIKNLEEWIAKNCKPDCGS